MSLNLEDKALEMAQLLLDYRRWSGPALEMTLRLNRAQLHKVVRIAKKRGLPVMRHPRGIYSHPQAGEKRVTTSLLLGQRYNELRAIGLNSLACHEVISREFNAFKNTWTPQTLRQFGCQAKKMTEE